MDRRYCSTDGLGALGSGAGGWGIGEGNPDSGLYRLDDGGGEFARDAGGGECARDMTASVLIAVPGLTHSSCHCSTLRESAYPYQGSETGTLVILAGSSSSLGGA